MFKEDRSDSDEALDELVVFSRTTVYRAAPLWAKEPLMERMQRRTTRLVQVFMANGLWTCFPLPNTFSGIFTRWIQQT